MPPWIQHENGVAKVVAQLKGFAGDRFAAQLRLTAGFPGGGGILLLTAATCEAKQKVHGEARAEDDPAGRTPAAGLVAMDGHLAGEVVVGRG